MKSARILLGVFLVSVSMMHLIELGHSVLHRFKNPLHNHTARHIATYQSHSLKDHHFPKMKFAYEMDEPAPSPNFVAIAFAFFQPLPDHTFSLQSILTTHSTEFVAHYLTVSLCPPSPPPLG